MIDEVKLVPNSGDLGRSGIVDSVADLQSLVNYWRTQKLTVGFTCGAFDLLHAGHADYLEKASALCDRLVVGVNSDDSIRAYKNPFRPIVGEQHRIGLVASLRSVSAAIIMTETRPTRLIEAFHPDLYIKGGDYGQGQLKSAPLVEAYGGRCVIIPVVHDISSSRILQRIEELSIYAQPGKSSRPMGPVVFLDRDGTLIENLHFLRDAERVRLLEGVGGGLRALQDLGFQLALATNQQGLGIGYFDYDSFVATNSALFRQLAPFGVKIAKVYFCPHSLGEQCECRKPGSALLRKGIADFAANPSDCFMIGDTESDMTAAEGAGCRGILVTSKDESAWEPRVKTFSEAVSLIVNLKGQEELRSR